MGRRAVMRRLRERLVLGPVHAALGSDEEVLAWGHVQAPGHGRHGLLALTKEHCVVHWISRDHDDVVLSWDEVGVWDLRGGPGGPVLVVRAGTRAAAVQLPVSSKARARRASALLGWVADLAPDRGDLSSGDGEFPLRPERRGVRGHTRRVLATLAGTLLILLGLLFASPFLPGPGVLTILAGLAILATEYDWARDVYNWLRGRVERFWEWRRARRARRRALRAEARDV